MPSHNPTRRLLESGKVIHCFEPKRNWLYEHVIIYNGKSFEVRESTASCGYFWGYDRHPLKFHDRDYSFHTHEDEAYPISHPGHVYANQMEIDERCGTRETDMRSQAVEGFWRLMRGLQAARGFGNGHFWETEDASESGAFETLYRNCTPVPCVIKSRGLFFQRRKLETLREQLLNVYNSNDALRAEMDRLSNAKSVFDRFEYEVRSRIWMQEFEEQQSRLTKLIKLQRIRNKRLNTNAAQLFAAQKQLMKLCK
jgi:hypothetical protein